MKYYLLEGKGEFWIRARTGDYDKSMSCPFCVCEFEGCGSWCPMFEVRECDKIPLPQEQDGSVLNYRIILEVRLHCGAGTRVIEIEEEKT